MDDIHIYHGHVQEWMEWLVLLFMAPYQGWVFFPQLIKLVNTFHISLVLQMHTVNCHIYFSFDFLATISKTPLGGFGFTYAQKINMDFLSFHKRQHRYFDLYILESVHPIALILVMVFATYLWKHICNPISMFS